MNSAVAQMDKITQQNAALVEEAASAAKSMEDQTASLSEMVSVFHLGGAVDEPKAKPAPRAAAVPASHPAGDGAARRPAPAAPVARGPQKPVPAPVKSAPARRAVSGNGSDPNWREF